MELARYVVDAVVLEGRGVREVARSHGVSKSWVSVQLAHEPNKRPHNFFIRFEAALPNECWQADVTIGA